MKIQQDARVLVQGHDLTRQHATPLPPKLLRPLFNQFARPSGLLGRLAGGSWRSLTALELSVV